VREHVNTKENLVWLTHSTTNLKCVKFTVTDNIIITTVLTHWWAWNLHRLFNVSS